MARFPFLTRIGAFEAQQPTLYFAVLRRGCALAGQRTRSRTDQSR
ncbi:hypothetical protein HMPREF0972_02079 [Actinomyces sp. oral taxon 848 str. F0332]|nr:hypothetical protein HMPREF0972_02079 [Actinomyces sp. oral taxon 848 str. F0332]